MSVAALAILYIYLRVGVATLPNSAPEAGNQVVPPAKETFVETQVGPDRTFAESDNAHNKKEATEIRKNGSTNSWPTNIEGSIWEYFAHSGRTDIISINSVECTDTDCEIEFYGSDINPQYVDDIDDLTSGMFGQNWGMASGSSFTRETAPNVRAFVIRISNVPVDMDELRRGEEVGTQQELDIED